MRYARRICEVLFTFKKQWKKEASDLFLTFIGRPIPFTCIPPTGNKCGRAFLTTTTQCTELYYLMESEIRKWKPNSFRHCSSKQSRWKRSWEPGEIFAHMERVYPLAIGQDEKHEQIQVETLNFLFMINRENAKEVYSTLNWGSDGGANGNASSNTASPRRTCRSHDTISTGASN